MNLLPDVELLARRAGEAIMSVYNRNFEVAFKDDKSPLTEADTLAHEIITEGLKALTTGIPILSEEEVDAFEGPNEAGRYWLVDPLDGTKEFVKKNGEFTVNIALIEQGEPVLGVVYAPDPSVLYAATKALGAFKVDSNGQRTRIHVAAPQAGTRWKVVGSRSHGGDMTNWLAQLNGEYELIPMGSSLKLCLVAEGKADIYPRLGPTSLWDTAAAQCIVEQAGGEVRQLNGEILSYGNPKNLLNPHFVVRARSVVPT